KLYTVVNSVGGAFNRHFLPPIAHTVIAEVWASRLSLTKLVPVIHYSYVQFRLYAHTGDGYTTMSNEKDALAELKALADLIKSNVDAIEAATKSAALEFPSLQTAFSLQSEAARLLPEVVDATTRIVAAASQLIAAVRPPPLSITYLGFSYHVPAALRVAVEAHAAEFLRDAGSEGAHVKDIAESINIDPYKFGL
ncbi:hypothetical protein EVG20_g7636, partial [Dentipellis fragilis]